MSRALVRMDPEKLALVQREHPRSDDHFASEPGLSSLLGQGFLVPEDVDEKGLLRRQYVDVRNDPTVVNLIVCPTLACNFGCDYCFQGLDKPLEAMTEDVQDAVVALYERMLQARPEIKFINMIWYGGEPLMRKQIIYDLADRLIDISARAGVRYTGTMVSNGFLMTREVAQTLFVNGLRTVQITLDGSEPFHDARRHLLSGSKKGTYQKIVQNIASWVDAVPISVNVRVNIDERNKDAVMSLIDDLVERGLSGKPNFKVYFSPVESTTTACHSVSDQTMQKLEYGRLEASLYRYAFERRLCSLPYPTRFLGICAAVRPNDYIVVPSGDVHKCWDTVSFPEKRVGTVFDLERLFLKSHPTHQRWERFDPFENEICYSCKILPNCASYCAHKFVYSEDAKGHSVLPCPPLKYSLNERLLMRAEQEGLITAADYDQEMVRTNPLDLTPRMHTEESMRRKRLPLLAVASAA
jgi:uncharacterized protein